MTITTGSKLPETTFRIMTDDGITKITTQELFAGKKVVLFAVPAAFSPTCSINHLPGYLDNIEAIKSKGVDSVAVVSTNDVFAMNAWAKATNAGDKIIFLSDGNSEFTQAAGFENDLRAAGMGIRSKRYSMIVDDCTVVTLNVEQNTGEAIDSGASKILEQL